MFVCVDCGMLAPQPDDTGNPGLTTYRGLHVVRDYDEEDDR